MNLRDFQVQWLLKGFGSVAVSLVLTACGGEAQPAKVDKIAHERPLPKVAVSVAQPQSLPNVIDLTGRVEASLVAEIRPQVTGIIQQKLFTEGSWVNAGQSLYQIDSASYQAEYDSAFAEVNRAKSVVMNAELTTKRNKQVVKINAISAQDVDNSIAAEREARSGLIIREAALKAAKIKLDRTLIVSPISGKIGRSYITQGALISENQATPLAVVQTLDPMYVDFALPAHKMMALKKALTESVEPLKVDITMYDGTLYPHPGLIRFSEFMVDKATDSVVLRAEFSNPDLSLLPGQFVRGQMTLGEQINVILIPSSALMRNAQGGAMVMVLSADQTVGVKPVVETGLYQGQWVITSGLDAGDQVITKGLQYIRPGVKAVIEGLPAQTASASLKIEQGMK